MSTSMSLTVHAPLDAAGARIALFRSLLASRAGRAVSVHVDDSPADSDSVASVFADLAWLGIAVRRESRPATRADVARSLVAAGHARGGVRGIELLVPPGSTHFTDLVKGDVTFANADLGHVPLVHADGSVDETFGAALDAAGDGVPLVSEDRDLERSARLLLICDVLGRPRPPLAHVGTLLPDAPDGTLPTIGALRRDGFLPSAVVDHLVRLGWSAPDGGEATALGELVALFGLDRVSPAPAHFNEPRLRAFNARALRALPPAQHADRIGVAMQRCGLLEDPAPPAARRWIETFLAAFGRQYATLSEALGIIADLRAEAVIVPAIELERLRNRHVVFFLDAVGQYVDAQPELRDLPLDHDLAAIADEFGIAHDDAFGAVRMALTGKHDGAPLSFLFTLLGHDRILMRIGAISSHLLHGRGLEPIPYGPGGVPFRTIVPSRPPLP